MFWLILGLALFALNVYFGIGYIKDGTVSKLGAFTWFTIGWLTVDLLRQLSVIIS